MGAGADGRHPRRRVPPQRSHPGRRVAPQRRRRASNRRHSAPRLVEETGTRAPGGVRTGDLRITHPRVITTRGNNLRREERLERLRVRRQVELDRAEADADAQQPRRGFLVGDQRSRVVAPVAVSSRAGDVVPLDERGHLGREFAGVEGAVDPSADPRRGRRRPHPGLTRHSVVAPPGESPAGRGLGSEDVEPGGRRFEVALERLERGRGGSRLGRAGVGGGSDARAGGADLQAVEAEHLSDARAPPGARRAGSVVERRLHRRAEPLHVSVILRHGRARLLPGFLRALRPHRRGQHLPGGALQRA